MDAYTGRLTGERLSSVWVWPEWHSFRAPRGAVGLAQLPEQHRDLGYKLRQRRSRDARAADKPGRRRAGSGYKFRQSGRDRLHVEQLGSWGGGVIGWNKQAGAREMSLGRRC